MLSVLLRQPRCAAVVLLFAPSALAAQQFPSRVFNPVVSPLNPDIVAFEGRDEQRQELQLWRISSGRIAKVERVEVATGGGFFPNPAGGDDLAAYSGDLDWRPEADNDRRAWFAYVVRTAGRLEVRLNYVDRNGQLGAQPITVGSALGGRRPRWSPNGKHLAFLSDENILHVIWGADRLLRGEAVPAARIDAPGGAILAPAWSPRGDAIAYQAERTVRGVRRYVAEVVSLDPERGVVLGVPIVLSAEFTSENVYRPSWSPDARFVAVYTDGLGQGAEREAAVALDISLIRVEYSQSTGRLFRGERVSGPTRVVAADVLADDQRGPAWVPVGREPDNSVQPGLVYVKQDAANGNPVRLASALLYAANTRGASFERPLSNEWGSRSHRIVAAVEAAGAIRYAVVLLDQGREVLRHFDQPASFAKGHAPVADDRVIAGNNPSDTVGTTRAPRGGNVPLAVVLPGAGQWSVGAKRGFLYTAAAIGGGALAFSSLQSAKDIQQPYLAALRDQRVDDATALRTDHDGKKNANMIGLGTIAAAWGVGLLDAMLSRGGRSDRVAIRMTPAPLHSGSGLASTQLGVRVLFGGMAR